MDAIAQHYLTAGFLIYVSIVYYLRQLRFRYIENTCKAALKKRGQGEGTSFDKEESTNLDGVYGDTL